MPELACFICGEPVAADECFLSFGAAGNYGSAIYDPLVDNAGVIVVKIHDKCVIPRIGRAVLMQSRTTSRNYFLQAAFTEGHGVHAAAELPDDDG